MSNPIYKSDYNAAQIEAAIGKGPRVNASGYWEVWNVETMAYESTGVGAGVKPPTVVTLASQMTNHGYIYIYNGSEDGYTPGYWYYWDGTAWTAGGAYQSAPVDPTLSVAGAAADSKATGDAVGDLKSAFEYKTGDITRELEYVRSENLCRGDSTMHSGYMDLNGVVHSSDSYAYSEHIPVEVGDVIRGYNTQSGTFAQRALRFVTAFNASGAAVLASGLNNGWNYTVPSGIKTIVISTAVGINYMFAVGALKTAYVPFDGHYIATEEFMGNVLNGKVDKAGQKQVTSENISDLLKTDKYTQSFNLFSSASLVASGKYVGGISDVTGKAYLLDNSSFDTYIIPVDGESTYTFTNCRTAVVVSDSSYTAVSSLLDSVTQIDSTGGSYILFSFNPTSYPALDYSVTKPIPVYQTVNWEFLTVAPKIAYDKNSGGIASGATIKVAGRTALKDGEMIVFNGVVTSFGNGFELDFLNNSGNVTNYISVDSANISIKYNTSAAVPVAHNLSISTANIVGITVQFDDGQAKIKLYANGNTYSVTHEWYQTGGAITEPSIKSNGTVFASATLEVTYEAAKRGLWVFGDSYVSFSDARWPYYLKADGYAKNVLLSGSPGITSVGSTVAMTALLNYGTPKIAVFATGMNDGSDTNGAAPSTWTNSRNTFLTLCESSGIEPVFCTIPTVPSVNNEVKNAWVKASGYRYIDFASSVGAQSDGTWYSGMLSGDYVHPTAAGAKALYVQLLIDLPEVVTGE